MFLFGGFFLSIQSSISRKIFRYIYHYFSVEDHHHEAMAFCWENGFHGVMSDDGEFIMFNPPKYFSAHEIKLSFQHDLNTTEFKIEKMAKELDLNPSRFCLVGALLGMILKYTTKIDFHEFFLHRINEINF